MEKKEFVENISLQSQLPVFYKAWYLNIFSEHWNLWSKKTDQGIWLFPYFVEQKLGFKLCRTAPLTPYYGPVLWNGEHCILTALPNSILEDLLIWGKQFHQFNLAPHYKVLPAVSDLELPNNMYTRVTHILDLTLSKKQLSEKLEHKVRRNIRLVGERLQIREHDFDIAQAYQWIVAACEKSGGKFYMNEGLFKKYVNTLKQQQSAILCTIYDLEGNPLALNLTAIDGYAAYNLALANNPAIKNNIAATGLLWNAALMAQDLGCTTFDFEGSKLEGVAAFFARFGAERKSFLAIQQEHSWLWQLKKKILG